MAKPCDSVLIQVAAIFLLIWPFALASGVSGICTSSTEVPDLLGYTVEPIPGFPAHFALCSKTSHLKFTCLRNYLFDPASLECVSRDNFDNELLQVPHHEALQAALPDLEPCPDNGLQFLDLLDLECTEGWYFDVLQRRCAPEWALTYESQCGNNSTTKEQNRIRANKQKINTSSNNTIVEVEICSPVGGSCGESPGIPGCICDPETCTEAGFLSDPDNCQLYFQCEENGFQHHSDCGPGLIFHPDLDPPGCVWFDHEGHIECRDGPKPTTAKPTSATTPITIPITPTVRTEPTPTVPSLSPEPIKISIVPTEWTPRTTTVTTESSVPSSETTSTTAPSSEQTSSTLPVSASTTTVAPSTAEPSQSTSTPFTKPSAQTTSAVPEKPTTVVVPTSPPGCRTEADCASTSFETSASTASTTSVLEFTTSGKTSAPPGGDGGGGKKYFILYFLICFFCGILAMALIVVMLWKRKQRRRRRRDEERIQFEAFYY